MTQAAGRHAGKAPRSPAREAVAGRIEREADGCLALGSPLYSSILSRVAADVRAGGPAWRVLSGREADARGTVLGLRLMAAVHRLVLTGRAPALAARYPSVGGDGDSHAAWPAFHDLLERCREDLRLSVLCPVQTNEVGRSAALLPGHLAVARDTGLPTRLLELGSSAGLNLFPDRYRYEGAGVSWGDPASRVVVRGAFADPSPALDGGLTIASRRGCDPNPLDPASPGARLTLESCVWADSPARLAVLRAALDLAAADPPRVDRAEADPWLEERLSRPAPGLATVVAHSVVMQYLAPAARGRVGALMVEAGARATRGAPLAWLRMEPEQDGPGYPVSLTTWPGGHERVVARAGPHGQVRRP